MRLTPYYLLALALVGLGDTFYLSYFQYLNVVPSCAIAGCDTVLTSVYSKFFGVPLSYIGLVYYGYMLGLEVMLAIDPYSKGLRVGALIYTGIGLLYSLHAVFYVQMMLIGAFCQYCILSAFLTLLLFGVALWHFISTR